MRATREQYEEKMVQVIDMASRKETTDADRNDALQLMTISLLLDIRDLLAKPQSPLPPGYESGDDES